MNYFELREMNREQLISYLKKLSQSYVPEWHLQEEEPELGSALAFIFADMYDDLIQKTHQIPSKHYIDFLNLQNPMHKSSSGSRGYATLTLSEGTAKGVMVKKGKQLIGTDQNGENLVFETTEDVMLVPAVLENIFMIDSEKDELLAHFNKKTNPILEPLFLMPKEGTNNLQTHVLTVEDPNLLNLKSAKSIEIVIEDPQNTLREQNTINTLSNPECAAWYYLREGKWLPFEQIAQVSGNIQISNANGVGLETPAVQLVLKKPQKITCEAFKINPIATWSTPDALYANEIEIPKRDGQIFSNPFYVYDAFYISSEEVFTKPGSLIQIQIDYVMETFPTPFEVPEPNIKWKNVLKKNDLKEVKEKEILITDLILEYWNGVGWSKLETIEFDPHMFEADPGEFTKRTIQFVCPADFENTNVGAYNNRWLRMRILQVENAYTLIGHYHVPKLKKMSMIYTYDRGGKSPQHMIRREFLEETALKNTDTPLVLFNDYGPLSGKGMYLKYDRKLTGGPIKILFETGTVNSLKMPQFKWQIFKLVAGKGRWTDLEVVDETRHFKGTGILTFIGDSDHMKTKLFGEEGYWLRAIQTKEGTLPVWIKSIHINTVRMTQKETVMSQYFELKQHDYEQSFKLDYENLENLELWVNEPYLTEEWLKSQSQTYRIEKSLDGIIEAIWIKWLPYEEISLMGPETRGYVVDLFEGKIQFGNSVNGYLPQGNISRNVRIDYSVNKGELGNVKAFNVQRLAQSIPNINKVYNPLDLFGGKPPESRTEALSRTASALHHNQRAKSIKDFDDLISAADHEIHRVKTQSHMDPDGKYALGTITSAILPKKSVAHQDYFRGIQQRVYKSLQNKLPCTLIPERTFYVIEAKAVTIDVHLKGIIETIDDYLDVYKNLESQINLYLDTYIGNQQQTGWDIGELPDEAYLLCLLQATEGLKAIDHLVLNAIVNEGYEQREIALKVLGKQSFYIIKGGVHNITLGIE